MEIEKIGNHFGNLFFKIVKAGFSHPRKQLINNLAPLFPAKREKGEKEEKEIKEIKEIKGKNEKKGKKGLEKEKIKIWLEKNNIKPSQRAETLTINDWKNLAKMF